MAVSKNPATIVWLRHDLRLTDNPALSAAVERGGAVIPVFMLDDGEKFDPDGEYVRCWVPELARMPAQHIHAPWLAPANVLSVAGVRIGEDYPAPIVDPRQSRAAALAAYEAMRSGR